MRKAVFVDRDGTVIVERSYLGSVDGVELVPGAGAALAALRESGYDLVLVTNQSGIGRGYFPAEIVQAQNQRLSELLAPFGVFFADVEICPHAPGELCLCRKPEPGLVLTAAEKLGVELRASFMIGDKPTDVVAGKRAGCRTVFLGACCAEADHCSGDIGAAAQWIVSQT